MPIDAWLKIGDMVRVKAPKLTIVSSNDEKKDPQISFRLYRKTCIQKILPILSLKHDGLKSSEIAVKAHSLGFKLKEIPVDYTHNIDSKAVPGGIRAIKVTVLATLALFQLWFQSIKEYRDGVIPFCPVYSKIFIDYIIGK